MTKEEIVDGLYMIKNWKCNGDTKMHEVVTDAIKALEKESKWIPVSEDSLPDEKWVLGYINNIHDSIGAPHMCVVKIRKGISKKERARLDKLKDPRAHVFYYYDEWKNNLVPYAWDTWGPGNYFGQEVVAWCELPEQYKVDEGIKNGKNDI